MTRVGATPPTRVYRNYYSANSKAPPARVLCIAKCLIYSSTLQRTGPTSYDIQRKKHKPLFIVIFTYRAYKSNSDR